MAKKLIYFATEAEAKVSLQRLKAVEIAADAYECDLGTIIVGGVGILHTMHALSQYIAQADEVWNLGVAGALQNRYRLGEVVQIREIGRNNLFPNHLETRSQQFHGHLFATLSLNCPSGGARLVTSDYPIHQPHLASQLAAHADLVDMEGYAVAYLAQKWQKPCQVWKVVSDFAQPGGPELIQSQLDNASERFAYVISANR